MARGSNMPLALALVLAAIAALVVLPVVSSGDPGERSAAKSCRNVVVQFEPEGSGGASEIRAKRIECRKARRVLRRCIKGELAPGWTGTYLDPKFVLRKDRKRIRYLPVGGGGCVPVS